jgi:hypothetical protein
MKKLALLASATLLSVGLSGCVTDNVVNAWDAATGASVPASSVVVAVNTFDALEATATNYLSLPRCTGKNGPVCRSPSATAQIIPAVRSGRVARNNLEQFLKQNPGKLGPSGLYNALQGAVTTLQGVMAQYNIEG